MSSVMHIDTSGKFYEKSDTGVAYKIVGSDEHKGLTLSNKLKRELDKKLDASDDYPRIYAICIFLLIKDNLSDFQTLVICDDENFIYVKNYLDLLFFSNSNFTSKKITHIIELRKITGNFNLKSYADGIANIYRKKGLKAEHRRQRGIKLNQIRVGFSDFKKYWELIEELMKNKIVSGG